MTGYIEGNLEAAGAKAGIDATYEVDFVLANLGLSR